MRPYEFWHPRLFETPYYAYLLLQCLKHGLSPRNLPKANWALDHGELGLGSKFSTQMAFDQKRFLPTIHIEAGRSTEERRCAAHQFVAAHGLPVILKPDIGAVGKGILKLDTEAALNAAIDDMVLDQLLQAFTDRREEYGVFIVRRSGRNTVTGINKKHFPEIVGNGRDSIAVLARQHYRYSEHWGIFLKYVDTGRVPAEGERVRLSFIGSHTMGCKFTDDTHLLTAALEAAVFEIVDSQPGFNFGRLDVKAHSEAAFQAGEFVVIEVNGIASLPTNMFDPANSLRDAYRIFLNHGRMLVEIAAEHRHRAMDIKSARELWRQAKQNHGALNAAHQDAIERHTG